MKKALPIVALLVVTALPIGCSSLMTNQELSTRTDWSLPLDPVPPESRIQPNELQALSKPLTAADVEAKVGPYLEHFHGMAGEKVRSLVLPVAALKARGEIFANLNDRHQGDLIFVEQKGEFTSQMKGKQRGETFPYAAIVVDARTGALVSRTLYADRYRPQ
jgi:hypothetical protein